MAAPNTFQYANSNHRQEVLKPASRRQRRDSELNELLYAKLDEIIEPGQITASASNSTFASHQSIFVPPHYSYQVRITEG
jgi:hypothetical protein